MSKNPETFTNSIGMSFVYISPCTFTMGSPSHERERNPNEIRHQVTLMNGFYMQTTPVTQEQWLNVMGDNPSFFKDSSEKNPVDNVSWYDCREFLGKLNEKEETNKYRLPFESEWECACRAGSKTRFYFGEDDAALEEYAWYNNNSRLKPHPVGEKKPNAWGLYDMLGNVWEWCLDWRGEYASGSETDPSGPEEGSFKIVRGGAWYFYPDSCRSACRNYYVPGRNEFYVGFRIVKQA